MRKIAFTFLIAVLAVQLSTAQTTLSRPVIGVSCAWNETQVSVSNTYLNSIMMAGGLPVIIPLSGDTEVLAQQIARIDALVMIGGVDFDPLIFGQEPVQALGSVVPEQDAYDLTLMRLALQQDLPILAICRGMQGLNIVAGGDLYQDIPSNYKKPYVKHLQKMDRKYGSHTITLDKNSTLYQILGEETCVVNSFHHQAVDQVAPGFRVVATASDGIIEAIEKEGTDKVIAVQWHPEGMAVGGDQQMLNIFRYIIGKAREGR